MESIIARALEYTLSHWLKSFSRDQFKLQGRTAQLSNLDINGDALHASVGLPPAINVTTARVGKLEITLPSVSNVQVEPIVVQIDRLDLVLEENADSDSPRGSVSVQPTTASGKGSGYGFADKIADGMTLEVGTVNLLLETHGGSYKHGRATWAPPMGSITIRNLLLYTTNETWQVVNLKEARDFSNNKKCIYVFKKLEWESLSVDLLPHPDMFADAHLSSSGGKQNGRDDDGVKRLFFGGERFLEGISGKAYITVQRTEQNSPLGLEVQLHITEAVCPALSEPGLRALLRFMTGLYVCLNRGDVDPMARKNNEAVAGRSLVSIIVDHIFFCIKDAEFQLELLMQSLFFSRASISDGKYTKNLSRIMVGGLFLRDTFSRPPCTLIQPSMQGTAEETMGTPVFCKDFCPAIYPLGDQQWQVNGGSPLIAIHSLQMTPSPAPPCVASQTLIECQPLLINLHEESCLRISSFLSDGIVVNRGCVLPDFSVSSFEFTLKGFDIIVPLDSGRTANFSANGSYPFETCFSGARLHVDDLIFSQAPSLKCNLLNLDKDPVCFAFWPGQPTDASMKKWATRAALISLSLETSNQLANVKSHPNSSMDLWTCVELREACFEAAMVTADGAPLVTLPPPEGIVRIGVSCQQYLSNASIEQLFFVLDLYTYFGKVSDKIAKIGRSNRSADDSFGEQLLRKIPSDTSVCLAVNELKLKFLESLSLFDQDMPLVQFGGQDLFVKVMHRTLGGAFAVSTSLTWSSVQVDCVLTENSHAHEIDSDMAVTNELMVNGNGQLYMRPVFWIDNQRKLSLKPLPFLDISIVHVMPFNVEDTECHSLNVICKISGVRLGGGMSYTESLLHRFGVIGPDGGPGEGLSKGIKYLSSGPLADLFKSSSHVCITSEEGENEETEVFAGLMELGKPDDIDVCIELQDWLFALEGAEDVSENRWHYNGNGFRREERCWHTTFKRLEVKAKSSPKNSIIKELSRAHNYPVDLVMVSIEGLQALKPHAQNSTLETNSSLKHSNQSNMGSVNQTTETNGGINLGASMVVSQDDNNVEMVKWVTENLWFSVKEPIEAIATKEELEHLVLLCRSEIDSMGRIAAGILRLFKLEESFGKGTIDGLSNLGRESLDKIFSPEKLSRRNSIASTSFTPIAICESPHYDLESTVASLESILSDSQAKCSSLVVELSNPEISGQHLADVKQLNQNLESLQVLLMRLRAQI